MEFIKVNKLNDMTSEPYNIFNQRVKKKVKKMIFKKIKEVITKFFYPDKLNKKKEQEIFDKAFQLRLVKNYISEIIFKDINKYKEYSKVDLIKELAPTISNPYLTQKDIEYAIVEVWTTYRNKIDLIKKKIEFKVQSRVVIKYYKNNSKLHKKGDLRLFEVKKKSTKFTKIMSFLARYGYIGIASKIADNLKNNKYKDDEKTKGGVSKKYRIDIPTKTDQAYHLNLNNAV